MSTGQVGALLNSGQGEGPGSASRLTLSAGGTDLGIGDLVGELGIGL